jgi:pilus assembly protein CpaB
MKLSVVGLMILGLLAALSAAVLMALLTVRRTPGPIAGDGEVTVLVATRDLGVNTLIDGAAVEEQKILRSKVPDQALSNAVQAIGKVTGVPVLKGQAFARDMFVTEGSGAKLAASFAPGMRAVAISLSDAAGLDGVLYPGSVVDVILTVKGNDYARSKTVLESVPVLAIERQTVIAKDAEKQDGGTANKGSNSRRVTLLVNSKQAAIVQLALNEGTLSLAMRNPQDKNFADKSAVSLQQLLPKRESDTSWIGALAAVMAKAAAQRPTAPEPVAPPAPPPAPPVAIVEAMAPTTAPAVTVAAPAKPKPGWETVIIRGGAVEKVEFQEGPDAKALAQKGS